MKKPKGLYIVENIYPLNSGNTIYSYGTMQLLLEVIDLDILTNSVLKDLPKLKVYDLRQFNKQFIVNNYLLRKFIKIFEIFSNSKFINNSKVILLRSFFCNNSFDVIVFDHLISFKYYTLLKILFPNAKLIYISHNFEYINLLEEWKYGHKKKSRVYKAIFSFYLQRVEKKLIEDSSIVVLISEIDKLRIESHYSIDLSHKGIVVNPTYQYDNLNTNSIKSKSLVFLGSMGWYPNIDGVIYFVENYFRKLVSIDSEWKFYIVGNNPSIEILNLASSNIIVTGSVDDVNPYLEEAMFSVVPNRLGSGLKIKFHESTMKGIPTIVDRSILKTYGIIDYPEELVLSELEIFIGLMNSSSYKKEYLLFAEKYREQIRLKSINYIKLLQDILNF
jgi:hypothetical protein